MATFRTIPRIPLVVFLSVLLLPSVVSAYLMSPQTYKSMFAKADIVVIATPLATTDSKQNLRLNPVQPKSVTGIIKTVETSFTVNHILKGKLNNKRFRYLHLNTKKKNPNGIMVFGAVGSFFVDFETKENQGRSFILFLSKRKDGNYQASWRPMEGSRAIVPLRKDGTL